uniref:Transducin-like enhancer protein 4 n=1 Tax=Seriola lalandi dorsalis TaxID=1841481 RepID=A0A3B4WPR9_SERLL
MVSWVCVYLPVPDRYLSVTPPSSPAFPPPLSVCVWCESRSVPLQPGQSFKFTVLETLDRIKEEFQFLQAQYHSLKLECEKLASEKTEMQRHYIMYYEMSYGLNIEMHKQVRKTALYFLFSFFTLWK